MEKALVNTQKISSTTKFYQRVLEKTLAKLQKGNLTAHYPNGQVVTFGKGNEISAQIEIKDYNFFRRCFFYGDIGFGESYMAGEWDTPDITKLLSWVILNIDNLEGASGGSKSSLFFNLFIGANKVINYLNKNSKSKAQQNIHYHYDLSNDFFKLMLDETMTYSSGIFKTNQDTLKDSQHAKYASLASMLKVTQEDSILEIGSGWGGNAIYLAQNFGCKVHSITISKEQLKYAKEKVKELELDHLITLEYKDFRDIKGQYDKIVSIEMIEAIGEDLMDEYFRVIENSLKPNGIVAIQAITSPDSRYKEFVNGVDFIQKHIFPGSLLPSVGRMHEAINQETKLHLIDFKDIGLHYARTLSIWRDNFFKNIDQVRTLGFDDTFIRKWEYYLCYCEAAFQMRNISDVQIAFSRPNNPNV